MSNNKLFFKLRLGEHEKRYLNASIITKLRIFLIIYIVITILTTPNPISFGLSFVYFLLEFFISFKARKIMNKYGLTLKKGIFLEKN